MGEISVKLQALLVFVLYVRCTAINPADPSIMSHFDSRFENNRCIDRGLSEKDLPRKFDSFGTRGHSSPSSYTRSSVAGDNSSKKGSLGELGSVDIPVETIPRKSGCGIAGIFCAVFIYEDCRKQRGDGEEQGSEEALFCTLCNAQVLRFD